MKAYNEENLKKRTGLEQVLYNRLFAKEGQVNPEGGVYGQDDYREPNFAAWLKQVKSQKNIDLLKDYDLGKEEISSRHVNGYRPEEHTFNKWANQGLRGQGHMMLGFGYGEGVSNNRQFPDEVDRYMSPHEDKVVKQVIKDMNEEAEPGRRDVLNEFTRAGAHGSQMLKPNAETKYKLARDKMIMGEVSKLRNQGYQQAAQIFNADRLAREQNISNRMQVPFGMQKFERGQLGTLENLNNMNNYHRQSGLNAAHSRFQEQRELPFQDISNLHSIMSQGGYRPSHNYEQPPQQPPSFFGQESKEGGRIGLRAMAEQLARKGRGGDTELAHINPIEAAVLKSMGGSGGINPSTGLKEYSFFTNPGKAIKGLGKGNRLLAETLGLAGGLFGGVGGGALGGAAKAALLKQNLLKGALGGAALGYALPAGAGMLGKAMGPNSGIGGALSKYGAANAGNFGSIGTKFFGTSGGPNIINSTFGINPHGGPSAAGASHNPFKVLDDQEDGGGFMGKMMGKNKGIMDYATALAPIALQGYSAMQDRGDAKKDRAAADRKEQQEREMLMRQVAADEARAAKEEARTSELLALNRPVEDERRKHELAKMKHEQDRWGMKSAAEARMLKEKEEREKKEAIEAEEAKNFLAGLKNREFKQPILAFGDGGRVACFKEGGRVTHNSRTLRFASGGYVDGSNSGVKDNVRADLPEGAYVLDATTISLLGDGNSKAGAKKVDDFLNSKRMEDKPSMDSIHIPSVHANRLKKQMAAGGELAKVRGRIVPAKISNGEYVLSPEDVLMFSRGGSLDEGSRMLDKMRQSLKGQKGVKAHGILPPSKPIEMYLRG
jgi:hypothetical protein